MAKTCRKSQLRVFYDKFAFVAYFSSAFLKWLNQLTPGRQICVPQVAVLKKAKPLHDTLSSNILLADDWAALREVLPLGDPITVEMLLAPIALEAKGDILAIVSRAELRHHVAQVDQVMNDWYKEKMSSSEMISVESFLNRLDDLDGKIQSAKDAHMKIFSTRNGDSALRIDSDVTENDIVLELGTTQSKSKSGINSRLSNLSAKKERKTKTSAVDAQLMKEYEHHKATMGDRFTVDGESVVPTAEALERVRALAKVRTVKKQRKQAKSTGPTVSYVNAANEGFNRRVERSYGSSLDKFKRSVAMGTAV